MTTRPLPTVEQVGALSEHRKRWGVDAVPTGARRIEKAVQKKEKLKSIMETIGTPADVVRGLMAKQQPKAGDTEHGGAAERVPPIDQHQADLTGGMPGMGA